MAVSTFSFLATCAPGVEPWLAREFDKLGAVVSPVDGGVEGRAPLATIRALLEQTRLAEALRVRPCRPFVAKSFEELQRGLHKVPWHAYMVAAHLVEVRVVCKQSRLYHSDAVAERAQSAIRRDPNQHLQLATAVDINAHRNRVYLRLHNDRVQVSIDAAGEALHRRGYRTHIHDAPLRETLAALLLSVASELADRELTGLWDPFCGSGTIGLEWLYAGAPNGAARGAHFSRRYIMDEWPCAQSLGRAPVPVHEEFAQQRSVWLSDIASKAIAAARANAQTLGAEEQCTFLNADFEHAASEVPDGTAVVTNAPYGVRLSTASEVNKLLRRLDDLLRRRPGLRPAVILWAGQGVPKGFGAGWRQVLHFKNGGVSTSVIALQ